MRSPSLRVVHPPLYDSLFLLMRYYIVCEDSRLEIEHFFFFKHLGQFVFHSFLFSEIINNYTYSRLHVNNCHVLFYRSFNPRTGLFQLSLAPHSLRCFWIVAFILHVIVLFQCILQLLFLINFRVLTYIILNSSGLNTLSQLPFTFRLIYVCNFFSPKDYSYFSGIDNHRYVRCSRPLRIFFLNRQI